MELIKVLFILFGTVFGIEFLMNRWGEEYAKILAGVGVVVIVLGLFGIVYHEKSLEDSYKHQIMYKGTTYYTNAIIRADNSDHITFTVEDSDVVELVDSYSIRTRGNNGQ